LPPPRGGAWRLGRRRSLSAALAADPAPGDDDAVVRFSFNVGADGKLEGAFRIADDEVESAAADAGVAEAAARIGWAPSASARPGAWSSLWRRLVLCEPSRAHRFRAAVRAHEWSEARRLALTVEEAAYVARSMARKDALDRALWSGDTREAARHARTAAERAAIGAYASGQAAGLKQVVVWPSRPRTSAALATAAATPLATAAAPAAATPARTAAPAAPSPPLSPSPPSPRAADTARAAATREAAVAVARERSAEAAAATRLQAAARVQRARFDADELRRRQWLEYHARSGRRDDALALAVTPEEVAEAERLLAGGAPRPRAATAPG